jgi:hypothetical protein
MNLHPISSIPTGQLELSRQAAERHQLNVAVAELRASRRAVSPPMRRVRHGLAAALVATARVIDAT